MLLAIIVALKYQVFGKKVEQSKHGTGGLTIAEYINREKAKRLLHIEYAYAAEQLLDEIPAADVTPVVRCKDCYQSVVIGNVLHCTYWGKNTDENGYCHEGG